MKHIYVESGQSEDKNFRKELASYALVCESEARRRAMVSSSKALEGIPIQPEELDQEPWLLNVTNGTLDLNTGELREHRREDLITKLAPVNYDPKATCPIWEEFLDKIMDGNQNLIRYLQKAAGYALTGSTKEQCLFFLYGLGANGKSTFLNIIREMMGEYAKQTTSETFMVKKGDHISCDIADLKGARFVAADEVENGRRLAEVLVKQITGGDRVKARFLYGQLFEYDPEYKIFLAANHKPVIRGTDNAIWRRIRLIPFTVQIPEPEQDKELLDKLKAELPGILNWAITGCLEWINGNLNPPQEVKDATNDYRVDMDILSDFFEDRCIIEEGASVKVGELYKAYTDWGEKAGEKKLLSSSDFGTKMEERGFPVNRKGKGGSRFRVGLRLRTSFED